jgi:hypothetical protein
MASLRYEFFDEFLKIRFYDIFYHILSKKWLFDWSIEFKLTHKYGL